MALHSQLEFKAGVVVAGAKKRGVARGPYQAIAERAAMLRCAPGGDGVGAYQEFLDDLVADIAGSRQAL